MTARMMSPALLVFTLVTEVSLHKAPSSSFSSRCQALVRSWTRCEPAAGVLPQLPDLRRRHEAGPQQAHLGQPRQPLGVQPAGLRPPGQLPGLGGVRQRHRQPVRLQHVIPDPPVVRGRLHDHRLDPVGQQPHRQRRDLRDRRGHLLDPADPPSPVAHRGQPGCTPPPTPSPRRCPRPARAAAGTPHPPPAARSPSPSAAACPPCPLSLEPDNTSGLPGDPDQQALRPRILTGVLNGNKRFDGRSRPPP